MNEGPVAVRMGLPGIPNAAESITVMRDIALCELTRAPLHIMHVSTVESVRVLRSAKFIAAEGGWRRIVWMNHSLREELRPALEALAAAEGIEGFVDMIATEQEAQSEEEVLAYIEAAGHPALALEPMM